MYSGRSRKKMRFHRVGLNNRGMVSVNERAQGAQSSRVEWPALRNRFESEPLLIRGHGPHSPSELIVRFAPRKRDNRRENAIFGRSPRELQKVLRGSRDGECFNNGEEA